MGEWSPHACISCRHNRDESGTELRKFCRHSGDLQNGVICSSRLRGTTLSRKSETGTARALREPVLVRDFRDIRSRGSPLTPTETILARRIAGHRAPFSAGRFCSHQMQMLF